MASVLPNRGLPGGDDLKCAALSTREQEIFDLAIAGFTDKEISLRLGIRPSTTKSYWLRIRQKTRALTRSQAISLMSSKTPVPASDWWSALLEHAPFSIIVCDADSVVLEARLSGHPLAKLILGQKLSDCVSNRGAWERAMRALAATHRSEPFTCELSRRGWTLSVSGTIIPGQAHNELGWIYLIDRVQDLAVAREA